MKKVVLVVLAVIFLLNCSTVFSKSYESEHFVIHSELDSSYVNIIQSNIESFYDKIAYEYFPVGWEQPLQIFYSKTQSDTRKLLAKVGSDTDVNYGVYISSLNSIFTHREMDAGGYSGLGTVFHEIVHHFVELNFQNTPAWFNEGLATFLGEQVRCVNDRLTLGNPNPWREQILRGMMEKGFKIDVKYITSLGTRKFYDNYNNYHPTRALFLWVYHEGYLKQYIKNAKQYGYSLEVLEKTVGKSHKEINVKLQEFVKKICFPAAYYQDGLKARSLAEKKKFYHKSLSIKPDYSPAMLEMANCFYREKNLQDCQAILNLIANDLYCIEYVRAHEMLGHIYYSQKDYAKAVQYYETAWNYGSFDIYRYQTAYSAGCCYHFLGNHVKAKQWLKVFLEGNWQPGKSEDKIKFAEKYQQLQSK